MKMAIMQPYVFPYLGYFQLIQASDLFVLYNDVNWINRGWINRNRILVNNQPFTFTVPCLKTSQNKCINEVEISLDSKTADKLLKTFQLAYNRAPYFKEVYQGLQMIFEKATQLKTIDELAKLSITWVLNYLGQTKKIKNSDSSYPDTKGMEKADRLIAICKKENGTHYINAPGGMELYDKEYFREKGLNLHFLKTKSVNYNQFNDSFIDNLSIIDILMFNDIKKVTTFLKSYELV